MACKLNEWRRRKNKCLWSGFAGSIRRYYLLIRLLLLGMWCVSKTQWSWDVNERKKCPKLLNSTTQWLYQLSWARKRQYLKVLVSPIWGRWGLKRPVGQKKVFTTKIAKKWNNVVLFREKTTQISAFLFTSLCGWLKLLFFCFSYSEKCVRTVG